MSPSEANWSFADFGPRLNNLTGLYLLGLYQGSDCAADAPLASWAEAEREPRKKHSADDAKTSEERLMVTFPGAWRATQFIPQNWCACRGVLIPVERGKGNRESKVESKG